MNVWTPARGKGRLVSLENGKAKVLHPGDSAPLTYDESELTYVNNVFAVTAMRGNEQIPTFYLHNVWMGDIPALVAEITGSKSVKFSYARV